MTTSEAGDSGRQRLRRATRWGALVGLVPFLAVLWDLRIAPLRTAEPRGFASNFYDVQARRLLHGHLTVPPESLGIEGFVVDGRTFMYFPPFPSILRMPVLVLTDRFDGRLTAISMVLAWSLLAAATIVLLGRVRDLLRASEPVSRAECWMAGLLVASITGGSVVVYLGSHPWTYHEAYLWSIAFSTATLAALATALVSPGRRPTVAAALFGLGAILTRTTSGWPMNLTLIAFGVWLLLTRTAFADRRRGRWFVVAGLVPLLIGSAVNIAKFRHPFLIPLDAQAWTDVNAHRRNALALNGGSLAGPQFLLTTIVNYFRPDGIRLVPFWPFLTLPAAPARSVGGAFLDQVYRTGSVPTFMPLLFVSSLWAMVTLVGGRGRDGLTALRIPVIGAVAVSGVVILYGYLAHRYLSEFMPALILGGIIGVVELGRRCAHLSRRSRRGAVAAVGVLAAFGGWANVAVGVSAARLTQGGSGLHRYVEVQLTVSELAGHGLDGRIEQTDTLAAARPADTLAIVGDCDALFISTGERYEPWMAIEMRDQIVVVEADAGGYETGVFRLFTIEGDSLVNIALESNGRNAVRLRVGEGVYFLATPWYRFAPGGRLEVRLSADTARDVYRISTTFGYEGRVALGEWRSNWMFQIATARPDLPEPDRLRSIGLTARADLGPPLDLCNRLLDRVDD